MGACRPWRTSSVLRDGVPFWTFKKPKMSCLTRIIECLACLGQWYSVWHDRHEGIIRGFCFRTPHIAGSLDKGGLKAQNPKMPKPTAPIPSLFNMYILVLKPSSYCSFYDIPKTPNPKSKTFYIYQVLKGKDHHNPLIIPMCP